MNIIKDYKFEVFPSPFEIRDYVLEAVVHPNTNFPSIVDHRNHLPPAWDQGREGACSAFAAAGMKQWQEFRDYGLNDELSKYFVYNLRSNYPSSGMYPRDTMNILKNYGIALKKSFDKTWVGLNNIPKNVLNEAKNHVIAGYAIVQTIDGLKKSLYVNGPCYGAFPVYKSDSQFWLPSPGHSKIVGGHAVAIVGYNNEGFIIRNSWGPTWNGNGHTIYKYDDWGSHWEIWTTIDEKTSQPIIVKEKSFFGKLLETVKKNF